MGVPGSSQSMAGEDTITIDWTVECMTMPLIQVHPPMPVSVLYVPVSHCIPVHPTSQVHVSGAEHVPPFWQGLLQAAAKVNTKKK